MTSNDWRIVRENLVPLHCEDVSWEQASDKIPLDLVRYLLGDLVQHLSTLIFLRGNRCLFTINWTHIPDSISVWENLLSDFFDKRIQTMFIAMLIGVVHILALGEKMYGKQEHCSQWSILRCYTYLQVCQDLLLKNLKWLEILLKVIFLI